KDGLQFVVGARLVLLREVFHEALSLMKGDQVDGRAAEAATGQSRAQATGMRAGKLNEQIQFKRAVPEKIPRAFVALKHVLAELRMIILAQRAPARRDAGNLAHYVPGAFIFALLQP